MVTRRFRWFGMLGVLLALIAQQGIGISVPHNDPVAAVTVLCHTADDTHTGDDAYTDDDTGRPSSPAPSHHPASCDICPLCSTIHVQWAALITDGPAARPPAAFAIERANLPPPATAPPALHRPPSQPRAPPIFS